MISKILRKSVPIGALAIAFSGVAYARMPAPDAAALLNKANQINYEEIETAKTAHDKAGDNQALVTYADTIKGDHEANQEAVTALSRQMSVKLEGTDTSKTKSNPMADLKGGAFNEAYLNDQVMGHKDALTAFKSARGTFKGDPDMELYVEQTIPVLEAHLKMAQSLKSHLSTASAENPSTNKSNTGGMGESSASSK